MKELWELFSSFARIGGFTFGGGYAMLPMLQKEVVEKRQWATEDEMLDYFAIGQCTPGVIFINTATFIGYKQKGIPGAIAATVGSVFPSLCNVHCGSAEKLCGAGSGAACLCRDSRCGQRADSQCRDGTAEKIHRG